MSGPGLPAPEVEIHPDGDTLARAASTHLLTTLGAAQRARDTASIVLTGGGIGTKLLAAVAVNPALHTVDWARIDIWWGDERFLDADDDERNERGARRALLDHLPIPATRIHPIASTADAATVEEAATAYAEELRRAAPPGAAVPAFDVLLLGVGPEGHVASIFPASPAATAPGAVVAVRDCPKPPPTRVTLTFAAITAAREVWVLASGAEKAGAVRRALEGPPREDVPAAGARGRERTRFLLDAAAAGRA